MKEVINLLPISSYLSTSYHVREVTKALDQLQTAYFHKKQQFLTTLEKEIPFPLSEVLKKLAIENEVKLEDTEEVDLFLNRLRDDIQTLPRLSITLSFPPTLELIKEINRWITLNLKAAIMLDFAVDDRLVAGAKIAFKGKIVDHSLKKRMEPMVKIIGNG
jgi:F0F1-type ATP synthase delta subunit